MPDLRTKPEIRFAGFNDAWEQRKLGDLLKYEQPQPYIVVSTEYSDDYTTPVLTAGQSFILGYTDEADGIKNADENNPVIIFDDFTTSSHIVDFPFKVKSSAMKLLTLRNGNDDFNFALNSLKNIRYIPQSHERHWISKFSAFSILVPNENEQKKIGTFFATLDHLITLHQREYDKTVNIKKAMLEKMFPKDGANRPEIRFSGFTDAWEQRKLGEVCTTFTDGDWIEAKDQSSNGIRLLQTGNIGVNEFIDKPDRTKWITEDTFARLKCFEVFPKDILISRLPEPAGRACIVPDIRQKMITAVDCTIVRTTENCASEYLVQVLSSQAYFKKVNDFLAGGTRQRISRSNLAGFTIPFPCKAEQTAIGTFFTHLDHLITLHQRELTKLQNIKKSLLEKMFV